MYTNGAIVFYRSSSRVNPVEVDYAAHIAIDLGLDPDLVPEYAGDRTTFSRALTAMNQDLQKAGYWLKPIERGKEKCVYALIKETKDIANQQLTHTQEARIFWNADNPGYIPTDAPSYSDAYAMAGHIETEYRIRRGKIMPADWTGNICQYLVQVCHGAPMKEDGRVYWIPPSAFSALERLELLVSRFGIKIIKLEIGSEENEAEVRDAASDSLGIELDELMAEASAFDGTQNPSTYASRLEQYENLRRRAEAYKSALGISIDECNRMLNDLADRVGTLFEERKAKKIPRGKTEPQEAMF